MDTAPPESTRRQQVEATQVMTLYKQAPMMAVGSFLSVLILLPFMWDILSRRTFFIWLAVWLAIQIGRFWLYFSYKRVAPATNEAAHWGAWITITIVFSACLWGSAGILMYVPGSLGYQALLALFIWTLAAGAMAALPVYKPAFYAFGVPTMLPLIGRSLMEWDFVHISLSVLGLGLLFVMLFFVNTLHKIMTESFNLRFENIDLVRNLTIQKEAAERAREQAEAANMAKSRFLAAASHDLRQPLHALGLFAATLVEKIRYPEVRNIVDNINASIAALTSLFDALLDISKLDANVVHPTLSQFPIQALFARIKTDYACIAQEKNLKFSVVPCGAIVTSDPILLERILRNLVANAIRYTEQGSVVLGCRRQDDKIRIEIWDSGAGIPFIQRQKIFEEFYQLQNPERDREKGLGLGLAIVKRLTHLLGHKLEVISSPDKGSMFSVSVPRAPGNTAITEVVAPQISYGGLSNSLILVVDDERAVREGIQALLHEWGCEVIAAGSLEEALQLLVEQARTPDVILADYRLRADATGIDAIRRLHAELGAEIPAVLITGDTSPERLREAKESGFLLLHKPVPPAKLRSLLSFMLHKT